MPRLAFPKNLREFQSQFATEEACRAYLSGCRWPDGFVCPQCGNRSAHELIGLGRWQCVRCRHQVPDSEIAHHCWRCGWEDADTEALELDPHKRVLADGGEDDYAETWGLLFDAGGDARANGIPFDEGRTQPWKEGWIAADINVGLAGIED